MLAPSCPILEMFKNFILYVCVRGRRYKRVTAQVWRSEDNLWKFSPSTKWLQGPCLGLEAWCLHPLGHLTRLYSSSPSAVRKVTTKTNTEEWICTYSPRGLESTVGGRHGSKLQAWQPEHKLRATSWVTSMSTQSNWNGVRLHTLEACLHDILPPTTGD